MSRWMVRRSGRAPSTGSYPFSASSSLAPWVSSIVISFSVSRVSSLAIIRSTILTGRTLDVALLEGDMFFQIEVAGDGTTETQYTRDGSFYLNPMPNSPNVMLTTEDGYPVMGENGPIVIADGFDSIDIQSNGQVLVQRGNQTEVAGNVYIVDAVRPRLLEAVGQNEIGRASCREGV